MKSIINNYFDKVYLINLDRRTDRLAQAKRNCDAIGLEFERFSACDGAQEKLVIPSAREIGQQPLYWNPAAAGMTQSLVRLLKKCREDELSSVLILEDDIEFHPQINELFPQWIDDVPADWETLYFGGNHIQPLQRITPHVGRMTYTYTLHCHAVRASAFDLLISKLTEMRNPADVYYANDIHSRGRSYCFTPNLAYQAAAYKKNEENINSLSPGNEAA
jgi:hypothetical protein